MTVPESIELRDSAALKNIAEEFLMQRYQQKECALASRRGFHSNAWKAGDIICIARKLAKGTSKEVIWDEMGGNLEVSDRSDKSKLLDASIRLSATLLTMICMSPPPRNVYCRRSVLSWEHGSLQDCLQTYFKPEIILGHDIKLEKEFNISSFCRITGFSIDWTDNLLDHLRLDEDNHRLAIFHSASFLKCQQSNLFPPGLADEALRTLALFFPPGDSDITAWVEARPEHPKLDKELAKCRRLRPADRQIKEFEYWHDRLVAVKELYDETRPRTISQLWYDRRNTIQWCTFWIAICLFIFTVAQIVEGALQTYKAYHPTDTTKTQL